MNKKREADLCVVLTNNAMHRNVELINYRSTTIHSHTSRPETAAERSSPSSPSHRNTSSPRPAFPSVAATRKRPVPVRKRIMARVVIERNRTQTNCGPPLRRSKELDTEHGRCFASGMHCRGSSKRRGRRGETKQTRVSPAVSLLHREMENSDWDCASTLQRAETIGREVWQDAWNPFRDRSKDISCRHAPTRFP